MADSKSGPDLVGAATNIRFIDEPALPALGFDLDKLCTCPDRKSCTNNKTSANQCDVPNTGRRALRKKRRGSRPRSSG